MWNYFLIPSIFLLIHVSPSITSENWIQLFFCSLKIDGNLAVHYRKCKMTIRACKPAEFVYCITPWARYTYTSVSHSYIEIIELQHTYTTRKETSILITSANYLATYVYTSPSSQASKQWLCPMWKQHLIFIFIIW